MANPHQIFTSGPVRRRPVMPTPKYPETIKENPRYRDGYNNHEQQWEVWRKSLDDILGSVYTDLEKLNNSLETQMNSGYVSMEEVEAITNSLNVQINNLAATVAGLSMTPSSTETSEEPIHPFLFMA